MNRMDTKKGRMDSDFGIETVYYPELRTSCGRFRRRADALLLRLLALWQILTGATARRLAKAGCVALSLIGMIGVAGAMERGTVSLSAGLAVCAVLLAVELLCLRAGKTK